MWFVRMCLAVRVGAESAVCVSVCILYIGGGVRGAMLPVETVVCRLVSIDGGVVEPAVLCGMYACAW